MRELLDDIVRRQLVADVPRCVLLSGGLDSSALTAIAARQLGAHGERVRSFAVDFVGQAENFVPDDMRATPDTPYVHDVAELAGTDHQDIVLSSDQLADPEVRAKVIRARDLPNGLGDMDASLYLLFKAIRGHSTVALSGESADEVFGGYQQFFDPDARRPRRSRGWCGSRGTAASAAELLNPALTANLRLRGVHPATPTTPRWPTWTRCRASPRFESRMREICYLHLTHFVRILLDRKDRASMAVGLEVRVPFCDHRLVEYVYNTPWSLKSFDGREKSLLRAATADVLPQSVVERVKSPYPSTQDPQYARKLQEHVRDYLSGDHPVFDIVDRTGCDRRRTPRTIDTPVRFGLERALDLALWLDMYKPVLKLS